ncbi:glycosyltransferase [Planomicrobium okeanokoites]|uniref:glycosyltransferase n=1 Tax=Planomicrobium okeanokoites TaxID=244 RepID=UPI001182C08C|nr:glycosyltransferase [Planomicrobium okeanokoites]
MRKNIAIIISNLSGGGAQRVASNLSMHLSGINYKKNLVIFDNKKIEYKYEGNLINLETNISANPVGKLFNFFIRIRRMRKIKKRENISTSISLLSGPNLVNLFSMKNDRVIVSVRNYLSKSSIGVYGRVNNYLTKIMYNKADLIIAVSESIKKDLIENFDIKSKKIKVIYNSYDIPKITELASAEIERDLECVFKCPTVVTVGRLSKQKGHWHLIRAFKRVKETVPNAKLVIFGEGELENYLKMLAKDLYLENDIYFMGFKDNPFKYIAKADVFAFPSLYEGFPNALCEAMACKVPIVSADCPSGPREILAPKSIFEINTTDLEYAENGILVPVCSGVMDGAEIDLSETENILSKAIINVLQDSEIAEKYKTASYKRVQDFNKDSIIKEWEKII